MNVTAVNCDKRARILLDLGPRLEIGAGVAELVDARDSKSRGPRDCEGSIPSSGTTRETLEARES